MTVCFFSARLELPPKRRIGGRRLSIPTPVVFSSPSRKALSTNFFVSSALRFSSVMIELISFSFCSFTNARQSSKTSSISFALAMKVSISSFLLRSSELASTARRISTTISLSSQLPSLYFLTSMRISIDGNTAY